MSKITRIEIKDGSSVTYEKLLEPVLVLLSELTDNEPCRLDHHGYCQTHNLSEDCSNKRAKELLKSLGYK